MKSLILIVVDHPDDIAADKACATLSACIDAGLDAASDIASNPEDESSEAVADANEQLKLSFGPPTVISPVHVAIDVEGGCVQNVFVTDVSHEYEIPFTYAVDDKDGTDESDFDEDEPVG